MNIKLFLVMLLALAITGCASAKKDHSTSSYDNYKLLEASTVSDSADVPQTSSDYTALEPKLDEKSQVTAVIDPAKLSGTQIQTALKKAGFYDGTVDGKIGPNTRKAIRDFQKANGLVVDGVAGKKTKAALAEHLS